MKNEKSFITLGYTCFLMGILEISVWYFDHLIEKRGSHGFWIICGVWSLCNDLFPLPLDNIGRRCSVILALPGNIIYYLIYVYNPAPQSVRKHFYYKVNE